jgi:hypothetical protein
VYVYEVAHVQTGEQESLDTVSIALYPSQKRLLFEASNTVPFPIFPVSLHSFTLDRLCCFRFAYGHLLNAHHRWQFSRLRHKPEEKWHITSEDDGYRISMLVPSLLVSTVSWHL